MLMVKTAMLIQKSTVKTVTMMKITIVSRGQSFLLEGEPDSDSSPLTLCQSPGRVTFVLQASLELPISDLSSLIIQVNQTA